MTTVYHYFCIKNKYFWNIFKSKYTSKRTKLHHLKNISWGSKPPNPPNKRMSLQRAACRFAVGYSSKLKKMLGPPDKSFTILVTVYAYEINHKFC